MNVSSVHGRMSLPENASYGCTKYAIEAFSDILRREMAKFDVTVSIIEPGHFGAATAVCGKSMVKYTCPQEAHLVFRSNSERI